MKLDLVHDIQKSYRKLLNCMSHPGLIENIDEESQKIDFNIKFYKSTMVVMLMLLDGEVNYKIVTDKEDTFGFVNQMTYANPSETKAADFIFILNDVDSEKARETFKKAKIGNLIDPHKSATIIFEVENLSNDKDLVLVGPGIKEANFAKIQGNKSWLEEREKKNIEYPLGIDIVFIDRLSNIMCLPRTTQVSKQVV